MSRRRERKERRAYEQLLAGATQREHAPSNGAGTVNDLVDPVRGKPAAIIDEVSVSYRTFTDKAPGIRQRLAREQTERRVRAVHAVKNASLVLYEGETLGFVGANGSGKSTLLSALTGLIPLDSGRILVRSRPRMLGVNAVLRPAVSGRRNILIGGLALGFSHAEMNEMMQDVIDFVDIGEAIDRPMKSYSAGMKSRLGFAIATLSPPEILLIDEALVTGDEAFKQRSQEKVSQIVENAGSVVLVTHNLNDLAENCDRAVWLDEGEIRRIGDPEEIVDEYRAAVARKAADKRREIIARQQAG